MRAWHSEHRMDINKLTSRELEIIKLTATGCTAKQIAKMMGLQYRTVQAYLSNIKKKLQAKNIAHAIFIIYNKIV